MIKVLSRIALSCHRDHSKNEKATASLQTKGKMQKKQKKRRPNEKEHKDAFGRSNSAGVALSEPAARKKVSTSNKRLLLRSKCKSLNFLSPIAESSHEGFPACSPRRLLQRKMTLPLKGLSTNLFSSESDATQQIQLSAKRNRKRSKKESLIFYLKDAEMILEQSIVPRSTYPSFDSCSIAITTA